MDEDFEGSEATISEVGSNIDPSIARFILSFENEIDSLRLSWEGKDIDYSTDPPQVIDFGSPLMNSSGIGRLISFLKSIIANKTIPMSNFDKKYPYYWSAITGYRIAKDIFVNMRNYDIKTTEDADRIIFPTLLVYQAHLLRAADEGERRFMKGIIKERSTVTNQKKGIGFGLT